MEKEKNTASQHQGNQSHSSTFQVLFLLLWAPSYFQLFMEQTVSHMVELEWFRSLLSEEKQEKKGLAVQANDISALASYPRPWKMQPLLQEGLQSNAWRQKQFGILTSQQNNASHGLVRCTNRVVKGEVWICKL